MKNMLRNGCLYVISLYCRLVRKLMCDVVQLIFFFFFLFGFIIFIILFDNLCFITMKK